MIMTKVNSYCIELLQNCLIIIEISKQKIQLLLVIKLVIEKI